MDEKWANSLHYFTHCVLVASLPAPHAPPFELLQDALVGSIVIAVVAYTTSYSLERMFAKQHNYESNPNQELLAQGLANVAGSFFRCAPVAASMSRSLVQQTVGGATQVANVVSCAILIIILLFMGPLVEPLPKVGNASSLFIEFLDQFCPLIQFS